MLPSVLVFMPDLHRYATTGCFLYKCKHCKTETELHEAEHWLGLWCTQTGTQAPRSVMTMHTNPNKLLSATANDPHQWHDDLPVKSGIMNTACIWYFGVKAKVRKSLKKKKKENPASAARRKHLSNALPWEINDTDLISFEIQIICPKLNLSVREKDLSFL